MLPGDDPPHVGRGVQAAVVVVVARLALAGARAAHQQAGGAVELVDGRRRCRASWLWQTTQTSRCSPAASRSGGGRMTTTDLAGIAKTVPPAVGGDRLQDVGAGQPLQQQPGQPGAVLRR